MVAFILFDNICMLQFNCQKKKKNSMEFGVSTFDNKIKENQILKIVQFTFRILL